MPTLAPSIHALISLNGSFERLVSTRRVIPISAPYAAGSNGLRFVSEVMERITQGYADALVAGRFVPPGVAESFKAELSERTGIVCVYQTVFARKMVVSPTPPILTGPYDRVPTTRTEPTTCQPYKYPND